MRKIFEFKHRLLHLVLIVGGLAALVLIAPTSRSLAFQNGDDAVRSGAPQIDPKILEIMGTAPYRRAQWGLLETEAETGTVLNSLQAERLFIPGSTAKLFSVSAALDTFGFDHRFRTPVYALGVEAGNGTLEGNLVLVASGDLTMGGRTREDGTVNFADIDHAEASAGLDAKLIPQDPLAGLNAMAEQVRNSGITRVEGEVIVDNDLFRKNPEFTAIPEPIIINDNLIDLVIKPGAGVGQPAAVTFRPMVEPYYLDVRARTVAAGAPTAITIRSFEDGRLEVSGTVAANSSELIRVQEVANPPAFARSAFIQALKRVGVEVTASERGPNPTELLPTSRNYQGSRKVAEYVSPPFREYARLILKVSHNLGANLVVCLMAAQAGSTDCEDGFPVMAAFLDRAQVDRDQVSLGDGRGDNNADYITPTASVQLLRYWYKRPEGAAFRQLLPILGVDGSLAGVCTACPARGKVFAKTGTVLRGDPLNGRIVQAQAYAGYIEKEPGKFTLFHVVVNAALAPDIPGALQIYNDVGAITTLLFLERAPSP